MNALGKSFVVGTAVVAVALACTGCGASANSVAETSTTMPKVAPTPTATQRPTAVPTATPAAASTATTGVLPEGEPTPLTSGRYAITSRHYGVPAPLEATYPTLSFTVPAGWSGNSTLVGKTAGSTDRTLPFLWAWNFDHGYRTRAPTTHPSCRPRARGPRGSSASSRASRASTLAGSRT